jgi:hypothetical protein
MDVHGALSHLVFATGKAMEPFAVDVRVEWRDHTYLTLYIECRAGRAQAVIDRLRHGFLHGPYDYRFSMIGWPGAENVAKLHPLYDYVTVSAQPDLCHDMRLFKTEAA